MTDHQSQQDRIPQARQRVEALCRKLRIDVPQMTCWSTGPGHQLEWTAKLEIGSVSASFGKGCIKRYALTEAYAALEREMCDIEERCMRTSQSGQCAQSNEYPSSQAEDALARSDWSSLGKAQAMGTMQENIAIVRRYCMNVDEPDPELEVRASSPGHQLQWTALLTVGSTSVYTGRAHTKKQAVESAWKSLAQAIADHNGYPLEETGKQSPASALQLRSLNTESESAGTQRYEPSVARLCER